MEKENYKITTSYGVLEAVSIISSITSEQCMVDNKKAKWNDYEYISVDFHELPGDILFDLDSSEVDEGLINRIIDELNDFEIGFKLKHNGVVYDNYDYNEYAFNEDMPCIEDFLKQFKDIA